MPQVQHSTLKRVWAGLQGQPKKILFWYVLGAKSTPPPDIFKQRLVQQIGKQFGIDTLVETGTYRGDMTAAAARAYKKVYSIELNKGFFDKAVERFKDNKRVEILFGDSAEMVRDLLPKLSGPAVFWLDAHGGEVSRAQGEAEDGPAPLVAEVQAVLGDSQADKHLILVDDVHTFTRDVKWGRGVWAELDAVRAKWMVEHPDWVWKVKDNVLRIYKKRS